MQEVYDLTRGNGHLPHNAGFKIGCADCQKVIGVRPLTKRQGGNWSAVAAGHTRCQHGLDYPEAVRQDSPDYTQVPNLLRDLMAEALRPLVGEAAEWQTQWSAGPLKP